MTPLHIRGFDASSTAMEVVEGQDLTGRQAIVTGGAGGIGVETARALAAAGASVTLAVRDLERGAAAAADIGRSTGREVLMRSLHLDDLRSVAAFAEQWTGPVHVLVANAAVMGVREQYTAAGWELQLATNHLGHFALATLLHDRLRAAEDARVVSVASSANDESPVVFDDLFFRRRAYDAGSAYGQSKTANVLFAVEAARRWADDGITANACMPGGIWTGLQQHWDPDVLAREQARAVDVVKTPEQGAATSVLLATAPELQDDAGGRYFEDCHEARIVPRVVDGLHGVRDWAMDPIAAARLWDVSTALVDAELRRLGLA